MTEREIFTIAFARDNPAERAAFLDEACVGDDALRLRVESLLVEYQRLGSFMDVTSTLDQPCQERPGTQIGPYKLLQQIGEGGMGVVYMAEQTEPVKRKVALKLIKPGMDSRQVIARFEAERQALSMMDHVNIARVLDAGTIGLTIDDFRFPIEGMQPGQYAIENRKCRPPLFRYGTDPRRAHHQILRRQSPDTAAAAGTLRTGLPGDSTCPPDGHHSS